MSYAPHKAAHRMSVLKRFLYFLISGISSPSWFAMMFTSTFELFWVMLAVSADSDDAGSLFAESLAPNPKARNDFVDECFFGKFWPLLVGFWNEDTK